MENLQPLNSRIEEMGKHTGYFNARVATKKSWK